MGIMPFAVIKNIKALRMSALKLSFKMKLMNKLTKLISSDDFITIHNLGIQQFS